MRDGPTSTLGAPIPFLCSEELDLTLSLLRRCSEFFICRLILALRSFGLRFNTRSGVQVFTVLRSRAILLHVVLAATKEATIILWDTLN